MTHRRILAPVLFAALCASTALPQSEESVDEPIPSELVERTERRLIQLDVSVTPKSKKVDGRVPDLLLDDFELVIFGRTIPIRYADRICRQEQTSISERVSVDAPEPLVPPTPPPPSSIPPTRGTYMFYFEHRHLTLQGQSNALVMAERLIPQLLRGGHRGIVVSSGYKLIQSEVTDDPQRLLDFIARIRRSVHQWTASSYAEGETQRYVNITEARDPTQARFGAQFVVADAAALARRYQMEERIHTGKQLRRFAATLAGLADRDPPKAALYFADIIRHRPGEHYMSLFGKYADDGGASIVGKQMQTMRLDAFAAAAAFDKVTAEAAAHGIRLYTVTAQGLQQSAIGVQSQYGNGAVAGALPFERIRSAEITMSSLALESGGAWFRGGTDRRTLNKIVQRIHTDLGCFYLLSFYPDELPEDRTLPVRARFNPDSARHDQLADAYGVSTRGQLVVQSERKRKESLLLAAHTSSSAVDAEVGRGSTIPLAFEDGRYRVLTQLAVSNADLPPELIDGASWDLGMTHVVRETVANQLARRVELGNPRVSVVLEATWSFPPGQSEVVSVAYEHRLGQIVTANIDRAWPDPDRRPVTITPIAVVQPEEGLFLGRSPVPETVLRTSGPVGIGEQAAKLDRPTHMISLVCRSKRNKRDLWLRRRLVGHTTIEFDLQPWAYTSGERCVQSRDVIGTGTVGPGELTYEVRVFAQPGATGQAVAERRRGFTAVDPTLSAGNGESPAPQ